MKNNSAEATLFLALAKEKENNRERRESWERWGKMAWLLGDLSGYVGFCMYSMYQSGIDSPLLNMSCVFSTKTEQRFPNMVSQL